MHEALTEGGLIRKLWIGEANIYRNHLLRLDRDSRHSRFGGAVSDEFIENYVTTAFGRTLDRKSTRLNSSHTDISRMPSSA